MTDTPILTPLTEIEKAELLDAIPGNLPQRMLLRRVLSENDALREKVKWLKAHRDMAAKLEVRRVCED